MITQSHHDAVLQVLEEESIDVALDGQIRRSLCLSFPNDAAHFSRSRSWHGSSPAYSVILRQEQDVIAHVGVVDRTISAGSRALRVAGVMNVFVLPSHRGRHLVERVMRAAMQEAQRRGMDIGLLFCLPSLIPLYARMQWRDAPGHEVVRTEGGRDLPLPPGNIAMYFPLRLAELPPGTLHLRGNDW